MCWQLSESPARTSGKLQSVSRFVHRYDLQVGIHSFCAAYMYTLIVYADTLAQIVWGVPDMQRRLQGEDPNAWDRFRERDLLESTREPLTGQTGAV